MTHHDRGRETMKKLGGIGAAMLLVLCGQAAQARNASASPDVFTATEGNWFKGSNWSQGAKPSRTVEVVIPAGHVAQIGKLGAEAGDTTIAGRIEGPDDMSIYGSVKVEPGGEVDLDAGLTVTGLGTVDFGSEQPYYLRLRGWHRLTAPLVVQKDLEIEVGATLYTQGYPVTVPRESYSFLGSSLYMGASTWRTGEWFVYSSEQQELDAHEATLIVNRPVLGEVFGFSSYACGCGWTYKNMTVEGYEPLAYQSFTVTGTLSLNRSVGGVRLEHGRTIEVGALASNGTATEPARVLSDHAGQPYTVRIPHDETVEGCLAVSDMHVEGGVLHDSCGADEGGNAGVVF